MSGLLRDSTFARPDPRPSRVPTDTEVWGLGVARRLLVAIQDTVPLPGAKGIPLGVLEVFSDHLSDQI